MDNIWFLAALWVGLALVATLLAIWFRVSTALSEIVIGTVAQLIIGVAIGGAGLGSQTPWVTFLAGTGAIVLTFLAGAELDPTIFRVKWKEATVVGLAGFFAPFLGSAAIAYYVLGWDPRPAWLAGVALSTTSVAVVYAVMLELGFNVTEYGKTILAACFINDLGTVIGLGLIFAPFTVRTVVFVAVSVLVFAILPFITPRFFHRYGGRVSELETKFILLALFGMGGLALWADSEPVLPAYIIGMVLAGTVGKDHMLIRRLRTLTFGLLTPFYFIRAGSLVSVPALVAAPGVFVALFFAKMISKLAGVFPSVRLFGHRQGADVYYTLMMSTGLTFGTISALFGLNRGIITPAQYSHLVAAVIGSAVIPTVIANAFFMPRHLLPEATLNGEPAGVPVGSSNTTPS
ncbi:MAG TPA: potassium transporter Kef [Candidatus Rokubacteria bacterium]|nr:MAG: potassium transporter Kef [Candidatus Rokubacteria bacterium GWA2_70_23]HAM54308.1 potassium transporter Kef [Candidatus Rokubacteria bacterium]